MNIKNFAHTGNIDDLINVPLNLSQFNNDSGCIKGPFLLSDLSDISLARSNIGIGSISHHNIDNVNIQGTNMQLKYMIIDENNFFFNPINQNHNLKDIVTTSSVPFILPISSNSFTKLHTIGVAIDKNTITDTKIVNDNDNNLNDYGFVKLNIDNDSDSSIDKVPTMNTVKQMFQKIKTDIIRVLNL